MSILGSMGFHASQIDYLDEGINIKYSGIEKGLLEDADLLRARCHEILVTFLCLYSLHLEEE